MENIKAQEYFNHIISYSLKDLADAYDMSLTNMTDAIMLMINIDEDFYNYGENKGRYKELSL